MGLLGEAWRSYKKKVVPRKANRVQIEQTQQAFYAGAFVVLNMMKVISEPNVSEEKGMELLHSLHLESDTYFEDKPFDPSSN